MTSSVIAFWSKRKTKKQPIVKTKNFIHFFLICEQGGKGDQYSCRRPPNESVVNQDYYGLALEIFNLIGNLYSYLLSEHFVMESSRLLRSKAV